MKTLRSRGVKALLLDGMRAILPWGVMLGGTLTCTTLLLLTVNVSPLAAYRLVVFGAFENQNRFADMLMLASSLLLCASGLTLTFAAGLYHLGIEGQITIGAIFAMLPLRTFPDSPRVWVWIAAFGCGIVGGILWGLLIAGLKHYGHVSEIFAGLGMNFLATGFALYLVFGPWKRPGIASMSGTERLPERLWLPTLEGLRLAPVVPVLALGALGLAWFLLTHTRWGLSLRATGLNPIAAERLGVPSARRMTEALVLCGGLAGITGVVQILAVFRCLTPNISSGVGFMALLLVLLARSHPVWVLPVAILFASFHIGSVGLPLQLHIDSSMGGVLQGALVLGALFAQGLRELR